jgi:uncharacterized membrane protein
MVNDMEGWGPKDTRSWRDRHAVSCLILLTTVWILILSVALILMFDGLTFNVMFWSGFFAFVMFMIWAYQGLTE